MYEKSSQNVLGQIPSGLKQRKKSNIENYWNHWSTEIILQYISPTRKN